MALIVAVARRKGDRTGADLLIGLDHVHHVLLAVQARVKGQHGGQSLRNGPGLQHIDLAVGKVCCLLGGHDDIFIVGQHKYPLGCCGVDGREDILGGGVHRLAAADHIVDAEVGEQLLDTVARCNRYEAIFLIRVDRLVREGRLALRLQIDQLVVVAVLYLHVVDLHVGQISQLQRRLDGVARLVGVDVALDDLLIVHHHNAVADRFEIRSQRQRVGIGAFLVDDKLGAVAEMDVLFVKLSGNAMRLFLLGSSLFFLLGRHNSALLDDRKHTLPDDDKALTSRVHNARFFEHRQLLGGLRQSLLGACKDLLPHLHGSEWLLLRRKLCCVLGGHARHGEDGALGRLHNRLVRRRYTQRQRVCDVPGVGGLLAFQALGKASEQQREDDAGVSSCAAQQRRGSLFGDLLHRRLLLERFQFPLGGVDSHRHVGAGVTVRHRENIERVHLLPAIRNAVCARDKRISELTSLYHDHNTP